MIIIDCGATAEGTPEYLLQFAFMGSYYAKRFLGVAQPRVALLNIGAEAGKGMALQNETYELLSEADRAGRIHFVGNIEGREAISEGGADVLVADGFTGNVFLKTYEGAALTIGKMLKSMFMKNLKTKVAALMVRDGIQTFKKTMNPSETGGTALLGISKPVIKAHGSSDAYAFFNAIRQAVQVAESGILQDIAENVEYMRLPAEKPQQNR